jgi:glycosyltransferase involved in cell wall biosynthesis
MKIHLLTHEFLPYRGGVATYVHELAQAASKIGHQITVVAPAYGMRAADFSEEPDYSIVRFQGGTYQASNFPQVLWRSLKHGIVGKSDSVHVADWPFLLGMALLDRISGASFVATAYGTEVMRLKTSRHAKSLALPNPFRHAKKVFAISRFTRKLLLDQYPDLDPDRIVITPLGVNRFWFEDAGQLDEVWSKFEIPQDKFVMLSVSRLDPRKGHRLVLEAISSLPARTQRRLAYVIVGGSSDPRYVSELRDVSVQLQAKVIFTGHVTNEELRKLYAGASAFCLPGASYANRVEGFGLVYLEAAAQGLPTIASRAAAIPEVVMDQQTGALVGEGDVRALAETIKAWVDEPDMVRTYGEAAREWANSFTWEQCAKQTYGSMNHAS